MTMKKTIYLAVTFLFLTAFNNGKKEHKDDSQSTVKYGTYHNDRYNYTVAYPDFLIPQREADNGDGRKFISADEEIQLLVYRDYKCDIINGGNLYTINGAYEKDLSTKNNVRNKKIEDNHYLIEYESDGMLHTYYVLFNGKEYFNILFNYPEQEQEKLNDVIQHVIHSFKLEVLNTTDTTLTEED